MAKSKKDRWKLVLMDGALIPLYNGEHLKPLRSSERATADWSDPVKEALDELGLSVEPSSAPKFVKMASRPKVSWVEFATSALQRMAEARGISCEDMCAEFARPKNTAMRQQLLEAYRQFRWNPYERPQA